MSEPLKPTGAIFEPVSEEDEFAGGPWAYQVHVLGSGFVDRALPVSAKVGDVPVEQIVSGPDGGGFSGLLATEPPDGALLTVGWAGLEPIETTIAFSAGGNV